MSVSSTATNNTSDSNCTASNNCATTGNNSNATNTDSSVPTDDNSNSSTTGYNSIGNSSSYAYEWLEIQALSAVVGQVVADACNYVSIYIATHVYVMLYCHAFSGVVFKVSFICCCRPWRLLKSTMK